MLAHALLTNTTADARNVLNCHEPITVMLLGSLGHAAETAEQMRAITSRLMAVVTSGSYLVVQGRRGHRPRMPT